MSRSLFIAGVAIQRRLSAALLCWLAACALLAPAQATAADNIEITQAHLEATDEGTKLSATFALDLNRGLEDAITRGLTLSFTTDVEITRPRWYWFDQKAIVTSQTIKISYNFWTRHYQATISGSLQQNFNNLDDALSLVRRPRRWIVADKGALKTGETYNVAVRTALDVTQLSKPFQVNALNNSDWRLSSDWKRFTYKAEKVDEK